MYKLKKIDTEDYKYLSAGTKADIEEVREDSLDFEPEVYEQWVEIDEKLYDLATSEIKEAKAEAKTEAKEEKTETPVKKTPGGRPKKVKREKPVKKAEPKPAKEPKKKPERKPKAVKQPKPKKEKVVKAKPESKPKEQAAKAQKPKFDFEEGDVVVNSNVYATVVSMGNPPRIKLHDNNMTINADAAWHKATSMRIPAKSERHVAQYEKMITMYSDEAKILNRLLGMAKKNNSKEQFASLLAELNEVIHHGSKNKLLIELKNNLERDIKALSKGQKAQFGLTESDIDRIRKSIESSKKQMKVTVDVLNGLRK